MDYEVVPNPDNAVYQTNFCDRFAVERGKPPRHKDRCDRKPGAATRTLTLQIDPLHVRLEKPHQLGRRGRQALPLAAQDADLALHPRL